MFQRRRLSGRALATPLQRSWGLCLYGCMVFKCRRCFARSARAGSTRTTHTKRTASTTNMVCRGRDLAPWPAWAGIVPICCPVDPSTGAGRAGGRAACWCSERGSTNALNLARMQTRAAGAATQTTNTWTTRMTATPVSMVRGPADLFVPMRALVELSVALHAWSGAGQ
jgi:hypothetical protein